MAVAEPIVGDDTTLATEIGIKLEALKQARAEWEPEWQEISDFVLPRRSDFNDETQKGKRLTTKMYDGTAHSAAQLLADGLQGYMTSPNSKWFKLAFAESGKDAEDDAKEWLEAVEQRFTSLFDRSNFYDIVSQIFLDGVTLGTATMYTEMDMEAEGLYFTCRHQKEIYIATDRYGRVDTVFRVYKQAKRNIVKRFSENLKDEYIEEAKNQPYEEDSIIHAVFPREDREAFKMDKVNKKYASVYILQDDNTLLSNDGYDELPYTVWRYRTNTDEEYGRSPAWSAISDIKVANQIQKTLLQKAHKSVEPGWAAPMDLKHNGGLNFSPNGVTYLMDMSRPPVPLVSNESYPIGRDMQEVVQIAIKEHFRVDFFLMLSQMAGQAMTATQVMEMQGEKAAIMSTMVSRLSSEFLNPLFDRIFGLVYRAGWLPDPPQSVLDMQGEDINVDYVGPLAQAVKRHFNTQNFKQSIFEFLSLREMLPRTALLLDELELGRLLLEMGGVPETVINDEETIKEIEAQMAQAEAKQQGMAEEAAAAEMYGKLTTAPESGSPAETFGG